MIKRSLRAFCNFTRHPVIGMVVVAAFAFFVYRDALGFLFFNDPTGHFRWMEGRSIVSFFVSAWGHAYYRPLSFVLWKALHAVLDHHDSFLLHSLNIVFHAANCSLVWLLAYRLTKHRGCAFMAAVLFALYPFSYEAVAYVGAFVHPLTTFFVLATLVLYREAKQGANWLFYASHLTLVLALFTQESAVIAPFLFIAWELIERGRAFDRRSLTYLIEPLPFLALWLRVPKLPTAGLQPLHGLQENALHFLQAIVYPVAPLASTLVTHLGIGKAVALVITALAALLALYVAGRRARTRSFFLSLAWATFSALPATFFLESAYVSGSPRLFYLTAVGAALLWATFPLAFLRSGGIGRSLLAWAMVAALAWFSLDFIGCRLSDFAKTTELMRLMDETARTTPAERELVYVNLPFHFSSTGRGCAYSYLYGSAGAVAIPLYADLADFIAFNGGPRRQARGVVVREFQPGWATYGDETDLEGLRALLAKGQVYLFDFFAWEFFDLTANWLVSPQGAWEEGGHLRGNHRPGRAFCGEGRWPPEGNPLVGVPGAAGASLHRFPAPLQCRWQAGRPEGFPAGERSPADGLLAQGRCSARPAGDRTTCGPVSWTLHHRRRPLRSPNDGQASGHRPRWNPLCRRRCCPGGTPFALTLPIRFLRTGQENGVFVSF